MPTPMQPPKRPKNEKASTTIEIQDRQIAMLTQRIADLSEALRTSEKRGDGNYDIAAQWKATADKHQTEIKGLRMELAEVKAEADYNRGYIARVKERDAACGEPWPRLNSTAPGS